MALGGNGMPSLGGLTPDLARNRSRIDQVLVQGLKIKLKCIDEKLVVSSVKCFTRTTYGRKEKNEKSCT